jgi:hypothetical protein
LDLVEETNFLTERGAEVLVSNIASQTLADKREQGGIYVGACESHNADVNKVEAAKRKSMLVVIDISVVVVSYAVLWTADMKPSGSDV